MKPAIDCNLSRSTGKISDTRQFHLLGMKDSKVNVRKRSQVFL